MKLSASLMIVAAGLLAAPPALACAPYTVTDPVTGETCGSHSAEALRREQLRWRDQAGTIFLARIRSGRMLPGDAVEFLLAPVAPLYGSVLPADDVPLVWEPGDTCNRFDLAIADTVVAFVDADGAVIGVAIPDELQDRPPDLNARLREIRRGLIGPDAEAPAR